MLITILVLLALSACSENSRYGGLNYGEVETPQGEKWRIIGGKDETNIEFVIQRGDGTIVTYKAEQSAASSALAAAAEAQKIQAESMKEVLDRLLLMTPAR